MNKDHNQEIAGLNEQVKRLSCELLQERITRIDFQLQLLTQWRQGCQQELNRLLTTEADHQSPESSHG